MTTRVEQWRDMVTREVAAQGDIVPVGLVLAIMQSESGGDPKAYRGEAAINDGSIGLMQVLLGTAKGMGYNGIAGDRNMQTGLFDPSTNIHYGVRFLGDLWNRLGNAADVISAYNGGIRPSLGFGAVWAGPGTKTVCLEKDSTGKCVRTFTAQPGQYGNQPYVDTVLALAESYSRAYELPPVIIDGSDDSQPTGTADPLVIGVVASLAAGLILFTVLRGR